MPFGFSLHCFSDGLAYRNARWLKILKAKNIYSETVGRDTLAMKWVNAADLTEEVTGGLGVELVLSKRLFARQQLESTLMYLDHQCILAKADRAIAHCEFREIGFDLKSDRTTVATAFVFLKRATSHWLKLHERANV